MPSTLRLGQVRIQTVCRVCGRPLLARYDLERAAPVFKSGDCRSRVAIMWRYAEVQPVFDPDAVVSLGEGMTPLTRAPRLGESLGLARLWVKDEGINPTGSFKARGLSAATASSASVPVPRRRWPSSAGS
jgi:threonine synthase